MTRGPASKEELSRRCTATLRFPVEPYHNLRCKLAPHSALDLHVVETTVPTEYVSPTSALKPAMAITRITWADTPTTSTN